MILVSTKDKLFEYNVKGFPKRQSTLSCYEFEIEAAYKKTSESSQTDIKPPKRWDYSDIEFFITKVITRIMDQPIEPDIDLFAHGCDRYSAAPTSIVVTVIFLAYRRSGLKTLCAMR